MIIYAVKMLVINLGLVFESLQLKNSLQSKKPYLGARNIHKNLLADLS